MELPTDSEIACGVVDGDVRGNTLKVDRHHRYYGSTDRMGNDREELPALVPVIVTKTMEASRTTV